MPICEPCVPKQSQQKKTMASGGPLDELEKWNDLLKKGIITQGEFDKKKKELLAQVK